ncbi:MAG: Hpt domain-containing protein [Planctomycetes bacterium]|nr:Hpt domain-containing protein [Planctomycetota bacterium]
MNDLPGHAADPALLELFRAELDAHLPVLSDGLLALEKERSNDETIAGMMRAAHSIKGAARIVGVEEAVRVAHVLEDCFTAANQRRISLQSSDVDVLLQGVDALQRICSPQRDDLPGATTLDNLIERIVFVRDGRTPILAAGELVSGASSAAEPLDLLITLPADLDDEAAEHLRAQLCKAIRDQTGSICLDFTEVHRVGTRALSVLISFVREAAGLPVLTVRGIGDGLARLMRVSGLDRAWSVAR